jgi:hypothetical protein
MPMPTFFIKSLLLFVYGVPSFNGGQMENQ